jgi:hypothetical protein
MCYPFELLFPEQLHTKPTLLAEAIRNAFADRDREARSAEALPGASVAHETEQT